MWTYGNLKPVGYMQFIDVQLLENRLLESLWYYHANPPMLNLLAGIGLKLFGTHAGVFFSVVFHVLGLLAAFAVYALTLRLSTAPAVAVIATAALVDAAPIVTANARDFSRVPGLEVVPY